MPLPATLVISDLHLGRKDRGDLLRRADMREPLLHALKSVDRLVILGDGLELREAAHRDALASAGEFFKDVGKAVGEIVMLAGNHDHGLAAGWIDGRLQSEPAGFLGLEERYGPTGPLARQLAQAAVPARLEFAYPGIWLREDVYAFHGHYSDLHATVPTFERVAAGAMAKWVAKAPGTNATPDDYEAVLSPLYAWLHALTQRADNSLVSKGGGASTGAYAALTQRNARALALNVGYRGAVASLNALGLGPLQASLSPTALRRGYLHGIKEVVARLQIDADYVLWGHSHRSGPWPTDDAHEWAGIVNTGSWVYQPHFLSPDPNGSPYWPGTAVLVENEGPPELLRLLGDRGHAELRPAPA
jgi:predicted phosphodiesterase